jgi:hypothetical protein
MKPWHEEARKMRSEGSSLQAIADKFGVTNARAWQVCKGIVCPVDHRAMEYQRRIAAGWRFPLSDPHKLKFTADQDAFIRENYGKRSASVIARELGLNSRNCVIGRAYRLGLCRSVSP